MEFITNNVSVLQLKRKLHVGLDPLLAKALLGRFYVKKIEARGQV